MAEEVTIDTTKHEKIRVFCVDCCKQAEILWRGKFIDSMRYATLIRVRCHGVEQLAEISRYVSSVKMMAGTPSTCDVFWTDLHMMDFEEVSAIADNSDDHIRSQIDISEAGRSYMLELVAAARAVREARA